ncbi:MAG TPA: Holliday junction branch migration DNA helicase RuvB [Polyangiaceae bacterium LLY-WYZ-15_(1-7)]|nr:Holliday junction branch migration DNA helicase RuvB [Polyangiaceae bacterium LLY-WYZ-15_(1-7)]HJL00712.1 Holliday junction branch migration DNA helicase RuvB [Polyangiaceae bacterium LLY-WYZ-15_(1-7)]HJL07779.1 Holliday junction branch migration DNA helicase RuvB [Polyangiaceae bacterium LLY-WYZ-15_(1-7)]HJL21049.1 Holliday junction branch migration DNA helicase RuvB [Polyangiaceae bacterium LLY-WYZ-15_(1-7)]HJL28824.1 Holliday junction branch migration DNA helicase RuvB [Polyangiaceae bact
MMSDRENAQLEPEPQPGDDVYEISLRPSRFEEFVGQDRIKDNLRVFVEAARRRGDPVDHVLFCGPPGLGKTTLAMILSEERGVMLHSASAPAIEHKGQLAALLTKLEPNDVLFIDEIHRLPAVVEENLYTAVEDFRIDIVQGDGPYAQTLSLPLHPFTLVGATTRTGLLTNPMRSRFGYVARLDYYPPEELATIVTRSAKLLGLPLEGDAAMEVARRSRGTPRIANRMLRRARDFAEVLSDGVLDHETAKEALDRLDVDGSGLDEMDRKYLRVIIEFYEGGPVGIETIAAALSEPRDTLEDVYEPYLLQQGFIARTPRGRVVTKKAWTHLKIAKPKKGGGPAGEGQESLF